MPTRRWLLVASLLAAGLAVLPGPLALARGPVPSSPALRDPGALVLLPPLPILGRWLGPRRGEAPREVTTVRASSARLVAIFRDALEEDFPWTADWSARQAERWLDPAIGVIALAQAEQSVVNTPIETVLDGVSGAPARSTAFRPKLYGRALVVVVEGGLIDVKGAGSDSPRQLGHSNGLMTLGEALRECMYQRVVQRILDHSGSGYRTLPCYGVVDLGFDVIHADGTVSRAGAVLRRAHSRWDATRVGNTFLPLADALRVERILRAYGVSTSSEVVRGHDLISIQATVDGQILDFGDFLTRLSFERPVKHTADTMVTLDVPELTPGNPSFVQPDPTLRLPFETWGYSESGVADSKQDNPFAWAADHAAALARGEAFPEHTAAFLDEMISTPPLPPERRGWACGIAFERR